MVAQDVGLLVRYVVGAAQCSISVQGGLLAVPVSGLATPLKAAQSMTGLTPDTIDSIPWLMLENQSGKDGQHSID